MQSSSQWNLPQEKFGGLGIFFGEWGTSARGIRPTLVTSFTDVEE
ncbi:MAG: hypothetical protein AAGD25_35250 [Cyanobacteria bacterium P01_F01_bin.150]